MTEIQEIVADDAFLRSEVLGNPTYMQALQEIGRDSSMVAKYQKNAKVMNLLKKIEAKKTGKVEEAAVKLLPKYTVPEPPPGPFPKEGRCQLVVKTLRGVSMSLSVDFSDQVSYVKQMVAEEDGVKAEKVTLCFGQRSELEPLDDTKLLSAYGIWSGATLYCRRSHHAKWGAYATYWECATPYFTRMSTEQEYYDYDEPIQN
mmetsp:Transcript_81149/g.173634  ORF Transcript_81149/g.173634 Transcript_81149/m.173634 type:complete len:202 (-) Transcript_81149:91-696(-)